MDEATETGVEVIATPKNQPVRYEQPEFSIEQLINQAINKKVPVDTMERLLGMRRELKAEYAKEQFDNAMAAFQGDCPVIAKTKEVPTKSGKKAYSYAPLDVIVGQVKDLLKKHGFSYAIQTETYDGKVKVICITKHIAGHTEQSSVELPLGNKTEVMSQTQVVAAALTFAKRYAFCNAFGILTGDEDDDAISTQAVETPRQPANRPAAPRPSFASVGQKKRIFETAKQLGRDEEAVHSYAKLAFNLEDFNQLTATQASKLIAILDKKLQEQEAQQDEPATSGMMTAEETEQLINEIPL